MYHCIPGTRQFDNFSLEEKLLASTILHVPHDAICLPHKILHKFCSQLLDPRENVYTKFCGENKLHYGEVKVEFYRIIVRNF